MSVKSIQYYGGKSNVGKGKWIADLLPIDDTATYVETHAGMLGVLLQRPKARCEIANDLNGRVSNWWAALRRYPDELPRLAYFTPHSRRTFDECKATLDEGTDLERAWKFFVVVTQSLLASDADSAAWYLRSKGAASTNKIPGEAARRLPPIAERIQEVQLENRPAIDILARYADNPHVIMYVDPPYRDADHAYGVVRLDTDETLELLRAQKGRVAVSGYDREWDDLGWAKSTYREGRGYMAAAGKRARHVETLWTNYEPDQSQSLLV